MVSPGCGWKLLKAGDGVGEGIAGIYIEPSVQGLAGFCGVGNGTTTCLRKTAPPVTWDERNTRAMSLGAGDEACRDTSCGFLRTSSGDIAMCGRVVRRGGMPVGVSGGDGGIEAGRCGMGDDENRLRTDTAMVRGRGTCERVGHKGCDRWAVR